MALTPTRELNDGSTIPAVGLGTYPAQGDDAARAVVGALDLGYRLIDTAWRYGNEDGVGRGIAESDVPREEIIVTTKVPGRYQGYDETKRSISESLAALGLDYVDLALIH